MAGVEFEDGYSPSYEATITTPERLTLEAFEKLQARRQPTHGPVLFEMGATEWIEIDALLIILAQAKSWHEADIRALFTLPAELRVRSFLRRWEFWDRLCDIYEAPIESLLTPESVITFSQDKVDEPNPYSGRMRNPQNRAEPLLSDRFFAIQRIAPGAPVDESDSRTPDRFRKKAEDEADRWRKSLVRSVLRKSLRGNPNRFATHVVYELVMNALWHPGASLVHTVSDRSHDDGVLRVAIWDDGRSVPQTLRQARSMHETLQAEIPSYLETTYVVSYDGAPTKTVTSALGLELTEQSRDEDFVLSSLFPGITSRPDRKPSSGEPEHDDGPEDYRRPGMGLYVATNTVARDFGGTLTIRTAGIRCVVRAPSSIQRGDRTLYVSMTRETRFRPLTGNLLVVEVPL